MMIQKWLTTFGRYLILMGRTFSRPERMRMFFKQYVKEVLHRCRHLHPDEAEHPEPLDAALGQWLHHP